MPLRKPPTPPRSRRPALSPHRSIRHAPPHRRQPWQPHPCHPPRPAHRRRVPRPGPPPSVRHRLLSAATVSPAHPVRTARRRMLRPTPLSASSPSPLVRTVPSPAAASSEPAPGSNADPALLAGAATAADHGTRRRAVLCRLDSGRRRPRRVGTPRPQTLPADGRRHAAPAPASPPPDRPRRRLPPRPRSPGRCCFPRSRHPSSRSPRPQTATTASR